MGRHEAAFRIQPGRRRATARFDYLLDRLIEGKRTNPRLLAILSLTSIEQHIAISGDSMR